MKSSDQITLDNSDWNLVEQQEIKGGLVFVKLLNDGKESWWSVSGSEGEVTLHETQFVEVKRKANGSMVHQYLLPINSGR